MTRWVIFVRPGGVYLAGCDIGNVILEADRHVCCTDRRAGQVDGNFLRHHHLTQHAGIGALADGGRAAAAVPGKQRVFWDRFRLHFGQGAGSGQKLQQQILEHGDQVRHDDEQTALAHPLGCGGVFSRKIIPKLHNATSIKRRADAFPSAHSAPHS